MSKLLLLALLGVSLTASLAAITGCTAAGFDQGGGTGGIDVCTACESTYFLDDVDTGTKYKKCTPCIAGCATCTSATNCQTCSDNFHPNPSTGTIATCDSGCTATGCATCSGATGNCKTCSTGYYATGAAGSVTCNLCSAVLDSCTACSSSTVCTACEDGKGVSSNKCADCAIANCGFCSADAKACTGCADGYNFPDSKKNSCAACTNNCKTCSTKIDQVCGADGCATGLTLNNTDKANLFCCAKDCTQCTSAATCVKCKEGVNLDEETNTCFGFKTGASLTFGAVVAVFALLF